MTKTAPQNTPFLALFAKNAKNDFVTNYISVHCIFAFCSLQRMGVQTAQWLHHLKKEKGRTLSSTQVENGFFPFLYLTMLFLTGL